MGGTPFIIIIIGSGSRNHSCLIVGANQVIQVIHNGFDYDHDNGDGFVSPLLGRRVHKLLYRTRINYFSK